MAAQLAGYLNLCEINEVYPQALTAVQFLPRDYRLYPVNIEWGRRAFACCRALYTLKTEKHPRGCIGKE